MFAAGVLGDALGACLGVWCLARVAQRFCATCHARLYAEKFYGAGARGLDVAGPPGGADAGGHTMRQTERLPIALTH